MKKIITTYLLYIFIAPFSTIFAQNNSTKPDSLAIYKDIEKFSKKRNTTNFIYKIFFRPIEEITKSKNKKRNKGIKRQVFREFEGKVIRNIEIETLDPFGYSVNDTSQKKLSYLEKAGNNLHIKSQRITIRNLLLFQKNDLFDSVRVSESERLIRTQKFVHEIKIYAFPSGTNKDSVDILIRESDKWSLIPEAGISTSQLTLKLTDKNIFGIGHEFQHRYNKNFNDGINSYITGYTIPNIKNTYINTNLIYAIDDRGYFTKSINVDRPFYSPLAKLAGGISAYSIYKNNDNFDMPIVNYSNNIKINSQDYWLGLAKQLTNSSIAENRNTNIVLTSRFVNINYSGFLKDTISNSGLFEDETNYFLGLGISTRKYYQDKFIFNYGTIEDIPSGITYGITTGYQVKAKRERTYLGGRFAIGDYLSRGYMSCNLEIGNYFSRFHPQEGVFSASVNYFTDLFEIKTWKFRQFLKPKFTLGLNRKAKDVLSFNNENNIDGFSNSLVTGNKEINFTIQTQSYAPWRLLGFSFGPYLIYSIGIIGNSETGFKNSHAYSQISLGILLKNDYLVFKYIQLSFSYYPIIPGEGKNIIKMNSNSTSDFGFTEFEIGKPGIVVYQ